MGERYTELRRISSNAPPKYGEWYQFTATIKFREDHLWTNTTYTGTFRLYTFLIENKSVDLNLTS